MNTRIFGHKPTYCGITATTSQEAHPEKALPGQPGIQGVSWCGPATSQPHALPLGTLTLQATARLKRFLKTPCDFSFLYGSFCLELSPPAHPPIFAQ